MKPRLMDFIVVFMLQLVFSFPFYTLSAYGLTISNTRVTKITSDQITIQWDTDEIAKGRVKYGETPSLGIQRIHENYVTHHQLILESGIKSDTNFFFAVESTDPNGNVVTDNNSNSFYTFKTPDILAPQMVEGLKVESFTLDSVSLSWDASSTEDVDHYVVYRNNEPIANVTLTTFTDTNIIAKSGPTYKVSAVDTSGNEGPVSGIAGLPSEALDNSNPSISEVNVVSVSDTSARVNWLTDEAASSTVFYGINKTDKLKSSPGLVENHTVIVDGLQKNVQYTFLVKSCDAASNCINASGEKFVSLQDTIVPFIDVTIPRYLNLKFIDIIGSVEPFSSISLYVNDMSVPVRSLGSREIGSSGKFIFAGIALSQTNVIRFVVTDKSGNRNEKRFDVGIDTEQPIVKLDDFPSLVSKPDFTISGNVNEQAIISIYFDTNANATSVPSIITGLNATKISRNSIELQWNESKEDGFSHYVVYRDNEAIAITKPSNFNLFIDALVDSGRTYTYSISAVNIYSNEGPKSVPLSVAAPTGGTVLNLKYAPVDVFEDFRKPAFTTNLTGNFKFPMKLAKGDGTYNLRINFEDKAGNSVFFERSIKLDSEKPTVKITSPRSGSFIFENVANEVDVVGTTKPNARVHLFVDRTPFSFYNDSFQVTNSLNEPILPRTLLDIPQDELDNLPEPQLDAKCRSTVSTSFCRTGADFSVDADASGNFRFENVDLTAFFGGAGGIREIPLSNFNDALLNEQARDSRSASIVVIATDASLQRAYAKHEVRIGTCWSGNQSWDIIPLTQNQRPVFLSTERMAEGTEVLRFYFNYTYIGPGVGVATGPPARIQSVFIQKACGTRELLDPRFNISCQIMPSGNSPRLLNPPENTVSYSEMPIARYPGMDKFLDDDWKSFFKAISNELTFPLRVKITYQHDNDGDGELETEFQQTCEQVSYVLDNTVIDPRKVLPDWLLYDAVDYMQDAIKLMDDLHEQINKVLEYVVIGCMTSMGLVLVVGAYRRYIVFAEEQRFSFLNTARDFQKAFDSLAGVFTTNPMKTESNSGDEQQYCQNLVKLIASNKKRFSMKYVTDADMKKCFPSASNAWKAEENVYTAMRATCDRVFGHSSPAGWTEDKNDGEILNKVSSPDTCGVDQAERGQPLRPVKCRDVQLSAYGAKKDDFDVEDFCLETQANGKSVLLQRGELVLGTNNLYELKKLTGQREFETKYAKKITENSYITASQKSCEELCGIKTTSKSRKIDLNGKPVYVTKDPNDKNDKKRQSAATCVTVDQCRSFNKNKRIPDAETGEGIKIQSAYSAGYSTKISKTDRPDENPCFYTGNNDLKVISDSPADREECCCINGAGDLVTHYYAPDDVDPITGNPIHDSKSSENSLNPAGPQKYQDIKFSYRYYKDKFEAKNCKNDVQNSLPSEPYVTDVDFGPTRLANTGCTTHYEYNPNRYISGRDFTACFGQNSWWDAGSANTVMVNPLREHLSAIQCVNIGGVSGRLGALKDLMTFMSSCLIEVRTTGRADAGVCKELFTQHVCGSIWQALRWFIDGCSPTIDILDTKPIQDADILAYVKGGLKSTYQSITDLQSSVSNEYQNAKLNDLFGLGEESIARKICLAAFGYDWELGVKSFVDAAYSQPFATLVQPITRSREFLSVDPQTFRPQVEYRASWLISPGCDFERYDVYLSCVGKKQIDKYPDKVSCGALGAPSIAYTVPINAPQFGLGPSVGFAQCDCIGLADEKVGPVVYSGRLKQNVLENKAIPAGKNLVTDNYRFDHLKFVLRPDRKITGNMKSNCFPTGYDEGVFYSPIIERGTQDVLDCRADPASGSFTCSGGEAYGSKKGTASILSILVNGINPSTATTKDQLIFNPGDAITVDTEIRNVGAQKCLKVTLDGAPEYELIDEGIRQYSLTHSKTLALGRSQYIIPVSGINIKEISLQNTEDDQIQIRFFDTSPRKDSVIPTGDGLIRFDQDAMVINDEFLNGESLAEGSKILQSGNSREVEVSLVDGNLRLKTKKGAEVEIIDAQIQRKSDGISPEKARISVPSAPEQIENEKIKNQEFGSVGGTFKIYSQSKAQEQAQNIVSQPKHLLIELLNMKANSDASSLPDSCNPNDAVRTTGGLPVKKDITITVESKQSSSGTTLPKPSKPKLDPIYKKDQDKPITITTMIPSSLVKSAVLTCTKPDGTSLSITQESPDKDKWEFNIGSSEITYAGNYRCEIKAEGKNSKAIPSSQFFTFNVECGPENNLYGSCVSTTGLCKYSSETYIKEGLKCYQTSLPPEFQPEI